MRRLLGELVAGTCLAAVLVAPGTSAAAKPSGPPLRVSAAATARALDCHGRLDRGRRPVLLLHGTTSDSEANWSWNWARALRQRHWSHCTLDLPASGNADIQVAAEHVVRAIRTMHRRAGRPIALLGHSQGGMIGRWALKYWPDTRRKVAEYVGLASSNHGTEAFSGLCGLLGRCTAANWQQRAGSAFLTALNRGPEVWPGIDYTEIATRADELVVPYTSVFLRGPRRQVTNTTVQDLCPTEVVEHFGMAYDNAAWLVGLDALTHAGPARLARVDRSTCGQPVMPAARTLGFPVEVLSALVQTGSSTVAAPQLAAEPRLRPPLRHRDPAPEEHRRPRSG